jgi:hypothetical protein
MTANPAVILIVSLFLFIYEIEIVRRYIGSIPVLFQTFAYYRYLSMVILYTIELSYLPMTTIAILAILAILGGVATLLVTGFTVISPVDAQTPTGDNTTMTGNMTGGNVTGGNMTGSISSFDTDSVETKMLMEKNIVH